MVFDIIVFNQTDLDNAINNGNTSIGLCDNHFILSASEGIYYTAIGEVSADMLITEEEFKKLGIICDGFKVKFIDSSDNKICDKAYIKPISKSSVSSYVTSYYMSSYFMTSYHFRYEYEYEYKTSFSTSYITSYITSYVTSYVTSYAISSYVSSYTTSYGTSLSSFITSYLAQMNEKCENKCVFVNGYGINLI